jgi:hypothetical protein
MPLSVLALQASRLLRNDFRFAIMRFCRIALECFLSLIGSKGFYWTLLAQKKPPNPCSKPSGGSLRIPNYRAAFRFLPQTCYYLAWHHSRATTLVESARLASGGGGKEMHSREGRDDGVGRINTLDESSDYQMAARNLSSRSANRPLTDLRGAIRWTKKIAFLRPRRSSHTRTLWLARAT